MAYERINTDPDVMGRRPRNGNLRIPVATVVAMRAHGIVADEIVASFGI
jgi:uncharacterized protein (DUF433 family)